MAQDIKMILQKDDKILGKKGGVIEVTSAEQVAYFENEGLAKLATPSQEAKAEKAEAEEEKAVEKAETAIEKKNAEAEKAAKKK